MLDTDPIHSIDADDRIVEVNAAWEAFAQRNGVPDLPTRVLGTSVWNHVHGSTVQTLSRELLEKARDTMRSIKLPFRCDAPDTRRFMELEISPRPDGLVDLCSRLIHAEGRPRTPVTLEAEGGSPTVACAWCKRFRCEDSWCEIEDALWRLDIFSQAQDLAVSHTICEDCHAELRRQL